MLTQSFSKMLITINYQNNREYISEFLCINKNKPEVHCEGQCYLKKQLKETEQAEAPVAGQNQKPQIDFTLFFQNFYSLAQVTAIKCALHYSGYLIQVYKSGQTAIFHPPQLTV